MIAFVLLSRTSNAQKPDTVCLERKYATKVLEAGYQAKVLQDNVKALAKDTSLLGQRIRILQSGISRLLAADLISREMNYTDDQILRIAADQRKLCENMVKAQDRAIKRLKTRNVITGISGVILTVTAAIISKHL